MKGKPSKDDRSKEQLPTQLTPEQEKKLKEAIGEEEFERLFHPKLPEFDLKKTLMGLKFNLKGAVIQGSLIYFGYEWFIREYGPLPGSSDETVATTIPWTWTRTIVVIFGTIGAIAVILYIAYKSFLHNYQEHQELYKMDKILRKMYKDYPELQQELDERLKKEGTKQKRVKLKKYKNFGDYLLDCFAEVGQRYKNPPPSLLGMGLDGFGMGLGGLGGMGEMGGMGGFGGGLNSDLGGVSKKRTQDESDTESDSNSDSDSNY